MKVLKRDINPLLKILGTVEIPINYERARSRSKKNNPRPGKGRSVLIGKIPMRNDVSNFTKDHPEIYEEIKKLSNKYCPFPVKSFMLNKNYQTEPHYDSKNSKESMIFSFGNYEGGDLIVENIPVKTHLQTYVMNSSKQLHWNLPITKGTRYSLIFFNTG